MDLKLNEEQEMIRKMAREFAEKEVAPIAAELDEKGEPSFANIKKMGELGFLGLTMPEEYGGSALDTISYCIAIEEISKACAATAIVMAVQNSLVNHILLKFGTDEQKKKYLPAMAAGQRLGAFALTEPQAGSDAANLRARAVRQGDAYVLNGVKAWCTNAPEAGVFIVMAVTDPARGGKGISAFIVEKEFPGVRPGKVEDKMGLRSSKTSELVLEDCPVPAANLLGREGEGLKVALAVLGASRIGIGAQSVGIAQGAFEEALKYAKSREAFGKTIGEFEAIQFMLADMATRIEAARLLVHRAAWQQGRSAGRVDRYSSMSKMYASEVANEVVAKAVQIHGGYGFSKEFPVERFYRDARVTTIYEGTSEIQRMVIARELLRQQG